MKRLLIYVIIAACFIAMTGCIGNGGGTDLSTADGQAEITEFSDSLVEELLSESSRIVLDGSVITASDDVTVNGTTATITSAGAYELTGNLDDGQIIVDTSEKVVLILNSVQINCSTASPVYIKQAENVTITLVKGTVNTVSDGSSYDIDAYADELDAAIYSKEDMVINGSGTLHVIANYNDGITSKDTLRIDSGVISVTAVNHGVKGKDYLLIKGGEISVQAGKDGLRATNDTEAALGYVEIDGGTVNITASDEGIKAITAVKITDGLITIETDNNGIKSDGSIDISRGTVKIYTYDDGLVCNERSIGKDAVVTINGAVLTA